MIDRLLLFAIAASEGPAGDGGNAPSNPFSNPFMLVMFVVLGLVMFLPMLGQKKEKRRRARVKELKKHDRIVTTGGIFGTVVSLDEETVTVEVSKDVRFKMKRSSIFDLENGAELDKQAAAAKGKKKVAAKATS
ncbi:MAG: preprotein translocase subunit YajC [Planctomycetota bacterium]|jgi:preprotein translocase subunit YajC